MRQSFRKLLLVPLRPYLTLTLNGLVAFDSPVAWTEETMVKACFFAFFLAITLNTGFRRAAGSMLPTDLQDLPLNIRAFLDFLAFSFRQTLTLLAIASPLFRMVTLILIVLPRLTFFYAGLIVSISSLASGGGGSTYWTAPMSQAPAGRVRPVWSVAGHRSGAAVPPAAMAGLPVSSA